jgi:hypothetical protein
MKRHLPTTANEGFKSPIHMITGQKARLSHILPFGSLVYFAVDKQQISDPKFDPRAHEAVYLGQGVSEGRKCVKGYYTHFRREFRKNYEVLTSGFLQVQDFFSR